MNRMRALLPEAVQATELTSQWFMDLLKEEEVTESEITEEIVHELEGASTCSPSSVYYQSQPTKRSKNKV